MCTQIPAIAADQEILSVILPALPAPPPRDRHQSYPGERMDGDGVVFRRYAICTASCTACFSNVAFKREDSNLRSGRIDVSGLGISLKFAACRRFVCKCSEVLLYFCGVINDTLGVERCHRHIVSRSCLCVVFRASTVFSELLPVNLSL